MSRKHPSSLIRPRNLREREQRSLLPLCFASFVILSLLLKYFKKYSYSGFRGTSETTEFNLDFSAGLTKEELVLWVRELAGWPDLQSRRGVPTKRVPVLAHSARVGTMQSAAKNLAPAHAILSAIKITLSIATT